MHNSRIRLIIVAEFHTHNMAIDRRKRHMISLEKMPADVLAAFNEKYPGGIIECEDDIEAYPKPSGEMVYAVTIELPDDIYLVKIPVEVDSIEDVQQWLESDIESDATAAAADNEPEDNTLPDDNIGQYNSDDSSDEE